VSWFSGEVGGDDRLAQISRAAEVDPTVKRGTRAIGPSDGQDQVDERL
jgi:hypothetical protein